MRTVKLTIAYDGTDYHGWQIQPGKRTVQGVLEEAFFALTGKKTRLHASGRTDAGVHAVGQVAHLKCDAGVPTAKLPEALNGLLDEDVAIKRAEDVHKDFHARFSAKSKLYRYRIRLSPEPDPFEDRYAWRIGTRLDEDLMAREIGSIRGEHDFGAFRASGSHVRTNVRTVRACSVSRLGELLQVDVRATGFLYNMMRNIAGTLVEIGRGYFPPGSTRTILASRDRKQAGPTAPANGLFLMDVRY
jgi:tRNA pseudouridine38-40 synthase